MEIARLEVSMQRHIDRMQETAKVNYVQYGKNSKKKSKPGKFQQTYEQVVAVLEAVETLETLLNMVERVRKFHYLQTFPGDVVKIRHQKGQDCKALEAVCRNCSIKGHFEKVCMKAKHSTHSVDVPGASNNSTGEPIYYNEQVRTSICSYGECM